MLSGNLRLIRLFDEIAIEVRQILSVLGIANPSRPVEVQALLLESLEARDQRRAKREMTRIVRQAKAEVMAHFRGRHSKEDAA